MHRQHQQTQSTSADAVNISRHSQYRQMQSTPADIVNIGRCSQHQQMQSTSADAVNTSRCSQHQQTQSTSADAVNTSRYSQHWQMQSTSAGAVNISRCTGNISRRSQHQQTQSTSTNPRCDLTELFNKHDPQFLENVPLLNRPLLELRVLLYKPQGDLMFLALTSFLSWFTNLCVKNALIPAGTQMLLQRTPAQAKTGKEKVWLQAVKNSPRPPSLVWHAVYKITIPGQACSV